MPVLPSNKRRTERRGQTQRGGGPRNHRQPSEQRLSARFCYSRHRLYTGSEPAAPCNGVAEPKHAIRRGVSRC